MAGFVLFLTFRRNVELFLIILHLTSHQALSSANFSPSVHAFFYLWYGIPEFDDEYLHWNHKVLPHWETSVNDQYPTIGKGHKPPENIHSPYYPLHGPYSTKDPKNLASQFSSMNAAKITVAVLSWWGQPSNINSRDTQGVTSDLVMHDVFHAADKDGQIKLAFHLEPYHSRSVESIRSDIEYIILSYGNYSSILRGKDGRPLFYVYDSYHIDPTQWQRLLSPQGDITVRDTPYDSVFIGLWLESHHGHDLKTGGFDGVYTYFASDGFSYGSSTSNWETISAFSKVNQLLCILSVGPGYEDTSIRPWNAHNSKPRRRGEYYREMWQAAISADPTLVSITSYNEWGEGTQIEPAKEVHNLTLAEKEYLNYGQQGPYLYLKLTAEYATEFSHSKSKTRLLEEL